MPTRSTIRRARVAAGLVLLCTAATALPPADASRTVTDRSVSVPRELGPRVAEIADRPPVAQGRSTPRTSRRRDVDRPTPPDALAALPSGEPVVPTINVDGIAFQTAFPPDTVGEVGTTHFVQMTNAFRRRTASARVSIFSKDTGALERTFILSDLAPEDSVCRRGLGDPVPVFDHLAGRWLLTEFFFGARGRVGICVYLSSGADPVASDYTVTVIETEHFPDYFKFGVWPDAYFVGSNDAPSRKFAPAAYAIDRAALLEGRPVTVIRRQFPRRRGFLFDPIAAVDLDGDATPPAGAPGILIRQVDDEVHDDAPDGTRDFIELFEFAPNFAAPDASVTTEVRVPVTEFSSSLCGLLTLNCIRQPGTNVKLDPLREPLMHRPVLRTFAGHQSLVGSFAVDVDGDNTAGVRWFELRRPAGATSGGWTLFQEGTVGGDGVSRWVPSIAMAADGDIALGYSISSESVFPSIVVTGRRAADVPGVLTVGETTIVAGTASQKATNRWGDYSAMSVDPTDGETFWYTNEVSANVRRWGTRIAAFRVQ